MAMFPLLPVEEEGRLKNPDLLDSFIQRVYAYHRWQIAFDSGMTVSKLIDFHTQYKMVLLSHCQKSYRTLGRLVAQTTAQNLQLHAQQYIEQFMTALKKPATRGSHYNVMLHLTGFLKHSLADDEKRTLLYTTERYRDGELPLIAPLTLLNMHFSKYKHRFTDNSLYLRPYPVELGVYNKL